MIGAEPEASAIYRPEGSPDVDAVAELLSAVLAGLSAILVGIATAAAIRYRDLRLAMVGGALGLFVVIGALSLLHELSPKYGAPFQIDPVPLGLAVAAVALLYVALVRRPAGPPSR